MSPVSILKPLRSSDPEQRDNFKSFCRLDYPCYELIFGALDPEDPGLETARRLATEYPERSIGIVSGGDAFGLNRKISNLEYISQKARYDLLVLCDSDMRVQPDYLRRLVVPFTDPNVGLVTCLYRGHRAHNLVSALEALGIGADFTPSVLVANRLEGMSFAFGSTIALTKDALDAIGGFHALADALADDYLLGNRVKAAGKKVVLSDYVVDDVLGSETFSAMWARRLRWARTMRVMRPAGWLGVGVTHGLPLALLFLLSAGFSPIGWAALGITLAIRAGTATWNARRYTRDENLPRFLPLLPLSDILSFALWIGSFLGSRVAWRGEQFRVLRDGSLVRCER